ncbi:MAG TPA: hypothetical protein VGN77_06855 [Steroidobacteraceae bacterium]|nr:hypothetical protein [Steroidobacteraceae bacterium]
MVAITTLWLPIVLAAIAVFVVSAVMHMFLGYHWNDMRAVPNQSAALDALRGLNLPPGDYAVPKAANPTQMRTPEYKAMFERGPLVLMNVAPGAPLSMRKNLAQWFVYLLVVGLCCAYIAGRELPPGTDYLAVFRLVGFSAFMAYSLALPQESIWYRRNWRVTVVSMIDGLVFAGLTAGIFGWLWPK